ncbi:MAG: alanine--tRNA ligase [Fimbriimonas ginsengisoli]|uniref:Alanine--tRNA ligase n=1 Tax=Fimbriimonas ginsengisoli TaxID=1005039 RepID=A0A931LRE5_FIMGI|nr:alanine--tRNA ligase [Fimbriimonas ginsengisoli]MBI3722191.1 alanine--tRNA ligase [Fimbriimonas ginsengisoli]
MTVRDLREKYLAFFQSKQHDLFPSGSLVPYDVTGRLDESLLFNGAGMVQFKPYFRGVVKPKNPRITTVQKCVRTGDIETAGDLTHLTFFEMLGNFSFGDYFKDVAIAYSWEFITAAEWLGLDPNRVAVTVFEEDDEAYGEWEKHYRAEGIDPASRIFRLGEETNYWPAGAFSSGPPGPCGPNTEMFYWTSGDAPSGSYGKEQFVADEAGGKWLEFWNDVFIQFEWQGSLRNPERPGDGYVKEGMLPLPFQSVDTGMGLERTITVLNGKRDIYDNDAFAPILRRIEAILGGSFKYGAGNTVYEETGGGSLQPFAVVLDRDSAARVVADHIRTAAFCIADGIIPGNAGRGYVLRRLIRRAVLKGQRVLGFAQPFSHEVFEGVIEAMGGYYKELSERRDVIVETLRNEEALFRRTVHTGASILRSHIVDLVAEAGLKEEGSMLLSKPLPVKPRKLPGVVAFKLYDTFGFPLEVTQELCAEAEIEVDTEGYERAMHEAQERSRGASGMDTVYTSISVKVAIGEASALVKANDPSVAVDSHPTATRFLGYESLVAKARIVETRPQVDGAGQATGELLLALDQTPFYAESGGQVSDTGVLIGDGFELKVVNLARHDGVLVHRAEPVAGSSGTPPLQGGGGPVSPDLIGTNRGGGSDGEHGLKPMPPEVAALVGQEVQARVDAPRRRATQRNHTATHLLHAALRQVLGKHVTQAGSYVGPDHLRFDFTHGKAMSPAEVAEVERIVNAQALENLDVKTYPDLPLAEAKARGAMALFGEKYGEVVRMVEVGDFSRELCGGTHVRTTGEIGLFKIRSEGSAASGVRRIEALTGEEAYAWVLEADRRLHEAAGLLKSNPAEVVHSLGALQEALKEERRRRERAEAALVRGSVTTQHIAGKASIVAETILVGDVKLWTRKFQDLDPKTVASAVDERVASDPSLVALAAVVADGKVQIICKAGAGALAKGVHAGRLVGEVAKICGGGGGGRPDFATAGGRLPEKVDEALKAAAGVVRSQMG